MSNIVKEKNFSILLAIRNVTTSFFYAMRELTKNNEENDDIELEKQVNKIREQEHKNSINNLEKMLLHTETAKKKSNKTPKFKVESKREENKKNKNIEKNEFEIGE